MPTRCMRAPEWSLPENCVMPRSRRAARNSGNLPLSGVDIQAVIRLYVDHVERCTTPRFESHEQAYAETGRVASDQDFVDIMKEFKAVRVQEIGHSALAITQFIASHGPAAAPVGSVEEYVDHGSAQGHERGQGRAPGRTPYAPLLQGRQRRTSDKLGAGDRHRSLQKRAKTAPRVRGRKPLARVITLSSALLV